MAGVPQEVPASLRERRAQASQPSGGREAAATPRDSSISHNSTGVDPVSRDGSQDRTIPRGLTMSMISWRQGVVIAAMFGISFIVIMSLRGALEGAPRGFSLFANLYLAGTIIFGGGPVVIPLLREYVVAEGWVSPRDFLLGLAIIQSFPGPNFNFAVYLGALAVQGTSVPTAIGALIGYIAIFAPGLILITGTMGVWHKLRSHRWLISCLRGVNAGAVGLIYTAVYRLWRIGYLRGGDQTAGSLESDPWWVVITATSFVGGMWFKLQAPVAILLGGAMGMVWYGIVKT
ncbi:MAG: hypothetical protein M1825_006455 [Sarcosagium campestre]|nr:MAG: hypothetical protein M1825_006455 [Sarcosagium campestre]